MVHHKRILRKNGFKVGHRYIPSTSRYKGKDSPAKYHRLGGNTLQEACNGNVNLKMHDSDGKECLNTHLLRSLLPAKEACLGMTEELGTSDRLNSYRLWHIRKAQQMFHEAFRSHQAESPNCKGLPRIDELASERRGLGWRERMMCDTCSFRTKYFELYNTLPTSKPGRKPVDLNYTCHVGLMHTGISSTGFTNTFAAMNIEAPEPHSLQRTANSVGKKMVEENELDMKKVKVNLKQLNLIKGLNINAPINVATDARYNNRMYSGIGKTPYHAASQATRTCM